MALGPIIRENAVRHISLNMGLWFDNVLNPTCTVLEFCVRKWPNSTNMVLGIGCLMFNIIASALCLLPFIIHSFLH